MASLIDPILTAADLGGCLGLDPKVNFKPNEPGMYPLISGFVGASLGPYQPLLDLLDPDTIIPTSPDIVAEFPDKLNALITPKDLVGDLIAKGFNASAKGMPSISVKLLGIDINIGDGDPLDPVVVPELVNFVTGMLMIPINFIKDIVVAPFIELEIPSPTIDGIKDLIEASIGSIPMPPGLPSTFAQCLLKVFLGVVNLFMELFQLPALPIPE